MMRLQHQDLQRRSTRLENFGKMSKAPSRNGDRKVAQMMNTLHRDGLQKEGRKAILIESLQGATQGCDDSGNNARIAPPPGQFISNVSVGPGRSNQPELVKEFVSCPGDAAACLQQTCESLPQKIPSSTSAACRSYVGRHFPAPHP